MKRLFSAILLLFSIFLLHAPSSLAAGERLIVSVDSATPRGGFVEACQAKVPLMTLQLNANAGTIAISDLYLLNVDPVTNQVTNSADNRVQLLSLEYANGNVATATLANGMAHFSFPNSNFLIPKQQSVKVTVYGQFQNISNASQTATTLKLSTVKNASIGGVLNPNDESLYLPGTSSGIKATYADNGIQIVPDNVSGASSAFHIVKSVPYISSMAPANLLLLPGNGQEIYRFSVLGSGCGDVELSKVTFDISTNQVNLKNIRVVKDTNSSFILNSVQPSITTNGNNETPIILDRYFPINGEVTTKNQSSVYKVLADVEPINFQNYSVSVNILGEQNNISKGQYTSLVNNNRIVWSDLAEINHGVTSPASQDWMNGAGFKELPSPTLSLTRNSGSFQTSGEVFVSLSSSTPASSTIAKDAKSQIFTIVSLKGAGTPITLPYITIKRFGSGNVNDFSGIWIQKDGQAITNKQTLTSTNQNAVFVFHNPINLLPGQTVELYVMADLAGNSNTENALGIEKSLDIPGGANIVGQFPLIGNTMKTSDILERDTLTIEIDPSSIKNINVSTNLFESSVGKFLLKGPTTKTIQLSSITFTQFRWGRSTEIQQLWLEHNNQMITSKQEMANAKVTFTFANPLTIAPNSSIVLDLKAYLYAPENPLVIGVYQVEDIVLSQGGNFNTTIQAVPGFPLKHSINIVYPTSTSTEFTIAGPEVVEPLQENVWNISVPSNQTNVSFFTEWEMGASTGKITSNQNMAKYTYAESGMYKIKVTIKESANGSILAEKEKIIRVGNTKSVLPPAPFTAPVLETFSASQNPFPDGDITTLEGKAALELYRRGVISGYPETERFEGNNQVNRAELLKMMLMTKFGFIAEKESKTTFFDVIQTWYTRYVLTGIEEKIIGGYPDGSFRPNANINTVEFLKIMAETFGLTKNLAHPFQDVDSTQWYMPYVGIAAKYDLFPKRGRMLQPGALLTRNEIAVALYQFLKNR